MKILLLSALPCLLAGCSNTTVLAHKTAVDINAEFSSDLARPLSANIGYESHATVAVPPRKSQRWKTLFNQADLPEGDVLSTISTVKVERVPAALNAADPGSRYALDFISIAATGKAATIATGTAVTVPVPAAVAEGENVVMSSGEVPTLVKSKANGTGAFDKAAQTIATDVKSIEPVPAN